MEAEFFCFAFQQDLAAPLVNKLNRYVDPTLALKMINVDGGDLAERYRIGQRYTRLLYASIPPERELSIEATTEVELFGNRIYLRIYWPMLVEGTYFQPGVGDVSGVYRTYFSREFHAGGHGLEHFLPALSIREQMVLVPRGQNAVLEDMASNVSERSPLNRSIIEVDFHDATELDDALDRVGHKLREQLRLELANFQSFRASEYVDIDAASVHLGVTPTMLRSALHEEDAARDLIYQQLQCTVTPATVIKDVQTRVSLKIENPSTVDLDRLRVQMRGPRSGLEINPERVGITLGPQAFTSCDFSVAATREGEFALEILFLEAGIDAPRDLLPVQHVWIRSVAG